MKQNNILHSTKKLTIEDCYKLAILMGGLCLSTIYINSQTKLEWQCGKCENIFPCTYSNVKNNKSWCTKCAGNEKLTIEDFHNLANNNGGLCLITQLVNARTNVQWQCGECKHIWSASYDSINHMKSWCPKCGGTAKYTIEECQKTAIEKGGKCISKIYINSTEDMCWECKFSHQWYATYANIKNNKSWCPNCNIPISELICKYVIEQIFNKPFKSLRPDWLKNPKTRKNLELDLYNEELNIGLEHQGRHHYEDNVYSNKNNLKSIQNRDQLKLKLCKQNNTKLIIIPELFKQTKLGNLQNIIIFECNRLNIKLPENISILKININEIIKNWYNV